MVKRAKIYWVAVLAIAAGFIAGSVWRIRGTIFENPASYGWAAVMVAIIAVILGILWQLKIAREQLRVEFFLKLREQFDGPWFRVARRELAKQLLAMNFYEGQIKVPTHDEINERVADFFEDMGMLYRRNYLDREMIRDTFSYYGLGWWNACEEYILEERRLHGNDETLFSDFEKLKVLFGDLPVADTKDFLLEEAGIL